MRLKALKSEAFEPNMTPMIDIVFLLMTFFIMVINFSQAESNEAIHLPDSELAQPPETPPSDPMTLQIAENEAIFMGNTVCRLDAPGTIGGSGRPLSEMLRTELRVVKMINNVEPSDVTVVIRADANVSFGFVQRVIQMCQSQGMESFTLRAKHGGEGFVKEGGTR